MRSSSRLNNQAGQIAAVERAGAALPVPIHKAVEHHAAFRGDASALRFEDCQLSYSELERRANAFANYLVGQGIGAEDRVCVCLDTSFEVIVSMLGIFKAGAVYVPLDPDFPRARLEIMIEDTDPAVIISREGLVPLIDDGDFSTFLYGRDEDALLGQPETVPDVQYERGQTAYVVYTSGTTGMPKGILASYENLSHYVSVACDSYRFGPETVMPSIARYTFSITFFELLIPLVAGGSVRLLTRDHILDFPRLVDTLEGLTAMHTSPSLFRKLLGYIEDNGIDPERFSHFTHVSTGGDLVPPDVLEAMKRVFKNAEIYVIYGCSEVACMACSEFVSREKTIDRTLVGTPFPGVAVAVCDLKGQEVSAGDSGEVYIGGAGVATGYLDRDELSAEKFVDRNGIRFYRTGDRGRLDENGKLEILGRTDFQIKLRGIRIEPGEIEAALLAIGEVREAVVVLRTMQSGEPGLAAFIVPEPGHTPDAHLLRSSLIKTLPEYMIPSAFVHLEALPLNVNNKVDRSALPEQVESITAPAVVKQPNTETERTVVEIWKEILGIGSVGLDDNFFHLGGESLLATRAVAVINERLKVNANISDIFGFETVEALSSRIDKLKTGLDPVDLEVRIRKLSRKGAVPLSPGQERIWFFEQLNPGTAVYNVPAAFRLEGDLDADALEAAIQSVVAKHPILRSVFGAVEGQPFQTPGAGQLPELANIDLAGLDSEEKEPRLREILASKSQEPFDLERGPLMRTDLIRLAETSNVLLVTVHHIVFDAWSLDVFLDETSESYNSIRQGRRPANLRNELDYTDYAIWQREQLEAGTLKESMAFWKRALEKPPSLLSLPVDKLRPPVQKFRGHSSFFSLGPDTSESIRSLSTELGATPYMVFLALFAAMLMRYTSEEDIIVGTPVTNRDQSELQSVIGFFVNTLALRLDLNGDQSFRSLVEQVRRTCIDGYVHKSVPFENVVESVVKERSTAFNPLVQAMFVFQNSPDAMLDLAGIKGTHLNIDRGISMFDLTLWITDTKTGFEGEWEYCTDLFDEKTVRRMAGHFETLAEAAVKDPEGQVAEMPILTVAEELQILKEWNDTAVDYPQEDTVHKFFDEQARKTPDADAVVYGNERLSYAELNNRSDKLAHYLRKRGVGRDVPVGLCLDRSLEMVIGILGILKAGGAYLPMDPEYPAERLAFMVQDADVPIILTTAGIAKTLPEGPAKLIRLDADWGRIAENDEQYFPVETDPGALAYVIYTSGSTGNPKGVMVEHKAILNHMRWMIRHFELTSEDRIVQKTPFSFDASVWEFLAPLLVGGQLIVAEPGGHLDLKYLSDLIVRERVTVLQLVPSLFEVLVEERLLEDCGSLRLVLSGGEVLSRKLASEFAAQHTAELHNLYGPTEATIDATSWKFERDFDGRSLPIGRPVSNVRTYILDDRRQPVPTGVVGEIYIGGKQLSRGYLNGKELTAEKFVPDRFSDEPGSRLYRTGDLGRFLPDGNIEFTGRNDHQVKVRGFRIELGEIETALCDLDCVKEAVVICQENGAGEGGIIAYAVGNRESHIDRELVFGMLRKTLPGYMLPSAIVEMERLPKTPNGKLDRNALPRPEARDSKVQNGFRLPRNETERGLVSIWEDVLATSPIGITDNFFEIGGHSLAALRMFSKVEANFDKTIPLATLFEADTIEKLADVLANEDWAPRESSLVPIQPEGSKPPLFCMHAVGGNVLFYSDLARRLGEDQPVYGLQARRLSGRQLGHDSIEEMAAYYIREIREVQPEGPYFLGGSSFGGLVAYEAARQLTAAGESIGMVAFFDTAAPGYPNYLRRTTALKRTIFKAFRRWQHHTNSLLKLSFKAKFEYIDERLAKALTKYRRKFRDTIRVKQTSAYIEEGRALPDHLLRLENRLEQAAKNYDPRPYPGKVTLFRASRQPLGIVPDPTLNWKNFEIGDLEIHEVEGHHGSIVREPYVGGLAEVLAECIDEAIDE
ncbi:MAG: non-ribosomal peptide synthetase [Acidobacteria bacterium]|nr:MAG: non-ribosomal peptide synthetase [Acidobacteriota bacterium]REK01493.1 MAG: non-ribosomal peptide synthetase [Acidobacteriota bacterium]REK14449.1 MAG: non-ribosomal peptide synthetase [Acidobacteriota bacterium]REK45164.1 MAG: non-ribosomal peptide synthetase [Acidobacteriota bacterium]